jgi:hypothetical protein
MTRFVEIRNYIALHLSEYLGLPVILSNQLAPEQVYPFVMYTVLTSKASADGFGNYYWIPTEDGVTTVLEQQAHATISISACSCDRFAKDDPSTYINGEDEAESIAAKAMDWFEHIGRYDLSAQGIVVVDVMDAQSRTDRLIDETLRRYGFDLRIRYADIVERPDNAIKTVSHQSIGD